MSALLRIAGAPAAEVEVLGRPARLSFDLNALARLKEDGSSLEQIADELKGASKIKLTRVMELVPLLLWAALASDETCGLRRIELGRLGPNEAVGALPILLELLGGSLPRPPTAPETSGPPAP